MGNGGDDGLRRACRLGEDDSSGALKVATRYEVVVNGLVIAEAGLVQLA
jgi:hypothetical protein